MGELDYRKALFQAIHAKTGLAAYLGDPLRVFDGVPRGAKLPYATLEAVSTQLLTGHLEEGGRMSGSIGIYSRHPDRSEILQVLQILSEVLEAGVSPAAPHESAGLTMSETSCRRLPDGRTWYGRIKFTVLLEENQAA
ncbi:DUF3168 domain-containing protein [Pseudovibrio sp. Tun.PSC04-5.I4]|uniref:DUF3168 domain-containing protein n=1 Tax=Pseudovibrio sp. Tun.PSC04-5.I4 TaxID=1798213 RepID=UPI00088239FC|nr:DUF3168 domain-containing protein [Pseudovibrio sp. Tun.PSC04-5.I4]SDQ88941.1 Protein of unknown function [Pseudovibrio sp. Tun.PSC04-5.I4]